MTTTANPLLENCCSPCNKCPDDGEILNVDLLPADECSGPCWGCCWGWCHDNQGINIQSTNDCLVVDTSECGVVKLTAECPKPTYVKAWQNITVQDVTPPDDCYIDGWDCWVKWWWEINATDEKVKACSWDTTPWYLNQKLEEWYWINIYPVGCDWSTNSKLRISIDEDILPEYDYPEIIVHNDSKLINTTYGWANWHEIWISDKETTSYDNNVCIGFLYDKDVEVEFNSGLNAKTIEWVSDHDSWRTVCTGNSAMATHQWIKILESWYYRVFWQLTVQNNLWDVTDRDKYFINLWRAFMRLTTNRKWSSESWLLGTAKHWAYWRQVLLTWWNWINISTDWVISFTWGSVSMNVPEWWWTVSWTVHASAWWWQPDTKFDWPWMTYNIDCYVDLYKDDVLTLWCRVQSNMSTSEEKKWHFRFVWASDPSTEFDNRLFWWTALWVQFIAPKLFQNWESNKFFSNITQ